MQSIGEWKKINVETTQRKEDAIQKWKNQVDKTNKLFS